MLFFYPVTGMGKVLFGQSWDTTHFHLLGYHDKITGPNDPTKNVIVSDCINDLDYAVNNEVSDLDHFTNQRYTPYDK